MISLWTCDSQAYEEFDFSFGMILQIMRTQSSNQLRCTGMKWQIYYQASKLMTRNAGEEQFTFFLTLAHFCAWMFTKMKMVTILNNVPL